MNCKPNDICIVLYGNQPVISKFDDEIRRFCQDKFVKVLSYDPIPYKANRPDCHSELVWLLDEPIICNISFGSFSVDCLPDACLRPIRDQPGEDESLSWAPMPLKFQTLELKGIL